jgi:nucleotide-binding universal stress UspA family protein
LERLVLAYDGSEPSKHAAARVADLAKRLGLPVTVLIVGELAPSGYGAVAPVVYPEVFDDILAEGVQRLRDDGVEAESRLEWGKPGPEIVRVAESGGCAMIVMGHRGKGGLESLLLGSVAKYVIDHAPCSVMVVR